MVAILEAIINGRVAFFTDLMTSVEFLNPLQGLGAFAATRGDHENENCQNNQDYAFRHSDCSYPNIPKPQIFFSP
jgi:hypothetical protein